MVATPMPAEATFNLGSPRTKAAMKVLGVLPQDLQPRERAEFPEGCAGDVRFEAWESKRRQLAQQVLGMAHDPSLDLAKSASSPALGGHSAGTNAFLADVLAKEQVSIEKMHKRAAADVQKIVLEEMAAKKEVEVRNHKLEEHRKRMVELKKAQDEAIKAAKAEAKKKHERSVEVRQRADRKLQEECEKLQKELDAKGVRVKGILDEREVGWEQNRIDKQAERETQYERMRQLKSGDMGIREKSYEGILAKTRASEDRLAQLQAEQDSHSAAKSDRTDSVIARARDTLNATQAEKDAAYLARIKVHETKKEEREARAKIKQKEYAEVNKKAKQAFERNYENVLKARERVVISPRMTKSMSESYSTNPAWQTENSIKAFEKHKTMGEVRQLNLKLLARAHDNHLQQALSKIEDMRFRVKCFKDSKDQAQFRREDMRKNVAIEKHHLTRKVERIRDAPPEKMGKLLEQMGLPPIRTAADEEAEEEKK